jgi:predicted flap endonuclease-1-like 5' DNA nuclease
LKEIPKSPSKAVLPQKNEENDDGNDIEENDDKEENSGHKTGDGEPSGGDSVGEPPSKKPDDEAPLTDIGGVTEDVANALRDADITTREQLTEVDLSSLAEINGISSAIAQRIKMQVG